MYNRYNDIEKFIMDVDKLELGRAGEVYISHEENYGILVDLEEQQDKFEQLKPLIVFVAKHVCELDNMVQRYAKKFCNEKNFEDPLVIIYIDEPNIITFEYWGAYVNTQYLVEFEYIEERFVLKRFGLDKNIPIDWE